MHASNSTPGAPETAAFFDGLTHLPSRALLIDRLLQAMARSARSGHVGAVVTVRLQPRSTAGADASDETAALLVRHAAERLSGCVRELDTVARLEGGDFALVLTDLGLDPAEAARRACAIARKAIAVLDAPFHLPVDLAPADRREVRLAAVAGVATFRDHEATPEVLFRRCAAALAGASAPSLVKLFDD